MKPVKKWIKITLDAALFILLWLMYNKHATGVALHEIGGLALIGLFVVHHLFNGKWILSVTRRIFAKTTPAKTKLGYWIDALLLLAFLAIGVTGALISKTVFSFRAGGNWKTLHYFASALTVALAGIHIGLHGDYLFGFLKRRKAFLRIAACALLAVILCFGTYSMATTSFLPWLSAPFTASAQFPGGVKPDALQAGEAYAEGAGNGQGKGLGNGPRDGTGKGQGGTGGGQGGGASGQNHAAGSVGAALTTFAEFGSIAAVFAALTYAIERLCTRKKRLPKAPSPAPADA